MGRRSHCKLRVTAQRKMYKETPRIVAWQALDVWKSGKMYRIIPPSAFSRVFMG